MPLPNTRSYLKTKKQLAYNIQQDQRYKLKETIIFPRNKTSNNSIRTASHSRQHGEHWQLGAYATTNHPSRHATTYCSLFDSPYLRYLFMYILLFRPIFSFIPHVQMGKILALSVKDHFCYLV